MPRFIDDVKSTNITPVYGYEDYPLLPLQEALGPVIPNITGLGNKIVTATAKCYYPNKDSLTRDESASIFIYTMEWGDQSLYVVLNAALRKKDRSSLKPWFGYLKLFDTALKKLPSEQRLYGAVYVLTFAKSTRQIKAGLGGISHHVQKPCLS